MPFLVATADPSPHSLVGWTLPTLGRRSLLAYRILFSIGLILAAISLAGGAWFAIGGTAVAVLGLVQGVVLLAVATMLFRRRPRDPIAAMLALAFLLWTITGAADMTGSTLDAALATLDRLRFLLLVTAVMLFPSGRFDPAWTVPAFAFTLFVFLLGLVVPMRLFLPPAVICVALAIIALVMRFRTLPPGAQRQQLKWVAFGLTAGLALILAYRIGTLVLTPVDATSAATILLEASFRLGVMLMALGFLVSLLRFRLYDAEAAISRSAAYFALTLALVAVFAASEATIELLGQRYLGPRAGDLSAAMAAAIAAVLLVPIHERASRWAELRFQRDLVVLKRDLPEQLADLRDQAGVAELADAVLPRIEAGVRSTRIALAIDGRIVATNDVSVEEAAHWLDEWQEPTCSGAFVRDFDDPDFPLRVPLSPILGRSAWLLLGPRPDGSFYRHDELEALGEVAMPLRRALAAGLDRERRDDLLRQWQLSIEARLAALNRDVVGQPQRLG